MEKKQKQIIICKHGFPTRKSVIYNKKNVREKAVKKSMLLVAIFSYIIEKRNERKAKQCKRDRKAWKTLLFCVICKYFFEWSCAAADKQK